MNAQSDTIAAIATAPGDAGIAIIRISGSRSLAIADQIFLCRGGAPSERPGGTFAHGQVRGQTAASPEDFVDEAVLLVFRAPHSYTREDVVEIHGHGGGVCARRILQAALDAGARLAEPGEFTRRAFLNGRIDLLQAEAVMDLIRARSERAASAALEQLEGRLSKVIDGMYGELLQISGNLEASLDFPEDDVPCVLTAPLVEGLKAVQSKLDEVLRTWQEGHILREGAIVAIVGAPNVGKSTLMNALLGHERSIVTEVPGTTRDTIEEILIVNGVTARLIDTAGIREAECKVEAAGVRRAMIAAGSADIVLFVVDASRRMTDDENELLKGVRSKRCIIVANKIDQGKQGLDWLPRDMPSAKTCLIRDEGVQDVRQSIGAMLGTMVTPEHHATISERHRRILLEVGGYVEESLRLALDRRDDFIPIIASQLRSALERLGATNGRVYSDDLLESIFSKFCIGK